MFKHIEKDVIVFRVNGRCGVNIAFSARSTHTHTICSNDLRPIYINSSSQAPATDSSWTPDQSRGPIRASSQSPRSNRRVRRGIPTLDQGLQKLPRFLAARVRRIVVDCEHTDRAEASTVDDGRLTRQGAVAIDTRVGSSGVNLAIAEKASGRIVNGGVDLSAASYARLDERRVNAIVIREGGDFGVVNADAVAER